MGLGWFKNLGGLLEREEFDLPNDAEIQAWADSIQAELVGAQGSEKTRLLYTLANAMIFLNQIQEKKKPKKPIVKNDKGKWVWVSDEDVQEKHELDDK